MTVAPAYVRPRGLPPRIDVTAHAVPDPDPPYDDGAPMPRQVRHLPEHRHRPMLRLVTTPAPGDSDEEESFEVVRTARDDLDDPAPRAALLTRALLEAIAGVRPVGQLAPWVSPEVLTTLHSLVAARTARPAPAALRRVLVSEPLPGIAEVTAVVQRGPRAEALALRLEGLDGRWVVTALQRP